MSYNNL